MELLSQSAYVLKTLIGTAKLPAKVLYKFTLLPKVYEVPIPSYFHQHWMSLIFNFLFLQSNG